MSNETKKATVKANGKQIEVYRVNTEKYSEPMWCDFADCKTLYKESELTFN